MELAASVIVWSALAYAAVGVGYGAWFLARALDRFDHAAQDSGLGFRLLILPGLAALWPLMELKRRSRKGGPA